MSQTMLRPVALFGPLILLFSAGTASAQWIQPWRCSPPVYQQAFQQQAYRTVPVTEYRQVTQTVQQPIVETEYVDQQVTVYKPVTETRTASVPTVSYQNVTEMQTVTRNAGYWQTHRQHNPRMASCQYDNRPGFRGWMNRTGFSIRQSFTPRVTTRRQYVPRIVSQQVPVTRRVAQHGTRQVSYQVTRMVLQTETRKVAVKKVRYVSKQVVRSQPVTVYRTVPTGSRTAFGVSPYGYAAPQSVQRPVPDPNFSSGQQPSRSVNSNSDRFGTDAPKPFKRPQSSNNRGFQSSPPSNTIIAPSQNASLSTSTASTTMVSAGGFPPPLSRGIPTAVRVHRTVAAGGPQFPGAVVTALPQ